MEANQITMHDLGDGVTVAYDPERQFFGSSIRGAAHVRFNGEYRFTCSNLEEAEALKRRAMFLPD